MKIKRKDPMEVTEEKLHKDTLNKYIHELSTTDYLNRPITEEAKKRIRDWISEGNKPTELLKRYLRYRAVV